VCVLLIGAAIGIVVIAIALALSMLSAAARADAAAEQQALESSTANSDAGLVERRDKQ